MAIKVLSMHTKFLPVMLNFSDVFKIWCHIAHKTVNINNEFPLNLNKTEITISTIQRISVH